MRTRYLEYTPDEFDLHEVRRRERGLEDEPDIDALSPEHVRYIIVHCTASRCTTDYSPEMIIADHRRRGFAAGGYHFLVRRNGRIVQFRRTDEKGAHCMGHNSNSFGLAYEGGLDQEGNPDDTLSPAQLYSMRAVIRRLADAYPNLVVRGHRDFDPKKACPCFDAKQRFCQCTNEPDFV